MKSIFKVRLALLFLFGLIGQVCWSQDTTKVVTNKSTTTTTSWFAQPWVWVTGGLLVVILLAFLFSNRSKEVSSTTRTTIIDKGDR